MYGSHIVVEYHCRERDLGMHRTIPSQTGRHVSLFYLMAMQGHISPKKCAGKLQTMKWVHDPFGSHVWMKTTNIQKMVSI